MSKMLTKRNIAIGLIVLGLLMLVIVAVAGPLHLAGAAFGPKKIAGAIAGVIVLGVGVYLMIQRRPVNKA